MRLEELKTYEIVEHKKSADLDSELYLLRHKKTGARITLVSNEDDNKVFYIGFRTPPTDSTGVAHILEHSVLCGSRNFPVKDPFVELVKGSLNTFLNAMTYPDKTVYPVASCNEKDFQNLLHVYLDAVFYPNIYREENIFRQEGWHYELETVQDELTINGVVYNEMKGAFSSPDDILDREVFSSLFPDTAYGVESGGHPDFIPDLTYEDFLEFHRKYYHPSNSYLYLYGNMDMAEKLDWIDRNYLQNYDAIQVDSEICTQKGFVRPVESVKEYSITEGESDRESTYLSYNTIVGTSLDRDLYIAFQILDYALCSAPGAPLKKALTDRGIGKEIYSLYENGIYQPYFSVVAKGTDADRKEEFVALIEDVLKKQSQGLDRKALQAGLNYYEFKYREADFASYPKGLMYGLQILDSWLYDDRLPFIHVEANDTFARLKERIPGRWFEELIETYLLNNTHKSLVMVVPAKGLTAKADRDLAQHLSTYKASLTEKELEQLAAQTAALEQYQEEPSRPEDMEKIPLLAREDIGKKAEGFLNEERRIGDAPVLFHSLNTNGIGYVKFLFFLDEMPAEYVPYLGILKSVLGYMDTEHYAYGDLFNEINIRTGGFSSSVNTYTDVRNMSHYRLTFEVGLKVLYDKMEDGLRLVEEILFTTRLEDNKRLQEIISELKSRMQASMSSAGHSLAAVRAMSYFSVTAALSEQVNGIPFYRMLERLEENFEQEREKLTDTLQTLMKMIFRPEQLLFDVTADEAGYQSFEKAAASFQSRLHTGHVVQQPLKLAVSKKNEGLKTSSQVQYVCRAGNFRSGGLEYTGALKVLKVLMGYEYLWNNVRVKGGAYGCMSSFTRIGDSYFVSYRDPNLDKTNQVYVGAPDFIRSFRADERTLTKFIIGAVSDLDMPLTPAAKGSRSLSAYLSGLSEEDVQKERDEVLSVTEGKIRELAEYVRVMLDADCICVVGNEDRIEQSKALFMTTENLFH